MILDRYDEEEHYDGSDFRLIGEVRSQIDEVLDRYLPGSTYTAVGLSLQQIQEFLTGIYSAVLDDLGEFIKKDPAAKSDSLVVLRTYTGFKAVMAYRIANGLYYLESVSQFIRESYARRIYEDAKTLTHIDIHPGARIGPGFVVDHGVGTVVGETCEIGARCTLLQCVILGSRDAVNAQTGKRHPTLGNDVNIGGFASIFGPVIIGDGVYIGPRCVVTEDIPAGSKVTRINELQISRGFNHKKVCIYGLVPADRSIILYGSNLNAVEQVNLVDEQRCPHRHCTTAIINRTDDQIIIGLTRSSASQGDVAHPGSVNISKLELHTTDSIFLYESIGLKTALGSLFPAGELGDE